jgi:hypothetical protein
LADDDSGSEALAVAGLDRPELALRERDAVVSRHVEIRFVSPSCALVSGFGTREVLTELMGGRPPVWATVSRGWVVQPHRARDLIAILDHRGGYDITVTNGEGERANALASSTGHHGDQFGAAS